MDSLRLNLTGSLEYRTLFPDTPYYDAVRKFISIVITAAVQMIINHLCIDREIEQLNADLEEIEEDARHENERIEETAAMLSSRTVKSKVKNYVDDTVNFMDENQFRSHFRISRQTFEELSSTLAPLMSSKTSGPGRDGIPAHVKILIFLEYLCNSTKTMREIGVLFNLAESTCHRIVRTVSSELSKLRETFIIWPTGLRISSIISEFQALSSFPGVIGAIDGTHVPIKAPRIHPECYFNRKKFYSVVMQIVCDANLFITDVFIGWPGASHDSSIFRNSPLFMKIQNDDSTMFPQDTYLIGDKAYPLTSYLITPYKEGGQDELSARKIRFNKGHSTTRISVERTIGCIKGRFRRLLNFIDMDNFEVIVNICMSACILHNMALMNDSPSSLEDYYHESMCGDSSNYESPFKDNHGLITSSGDLKRNAILDIVIPE